MNKQMNDDDLIRLVQEKPPEELAPEEIELLRLRLRESDHLQEVLIRQLQMESYLNDVLGEIQISVDAILEGTAEVEPKVEGRGFWRWGWPTMLLLMLAVIFGIVASLSDKNEQEPADITAVSEQDQTGESQQTAADGSTKTDAGDGTSTTNSNGTTTGQTPPKNNTNQTVNVTAIPDPWAVSLDPSKPARVFEEVCFTGPKLSKVDELPAKNLQPWFESVQGQPHRIQNVKTGNHTFSQFQGVAKLRAPWPNDAVLRLTLFEIKNLRIEFWNGEQGILLEYFQQRSPHLWAAYQMTRAGNQPEGEKQALLTTDNSRYVRSNSGTFELRHQNGALLMTRGNVLLLSVPMEAPPTEVYFAGLVRFRSISMYRSEPFPEQPDKQGTLVLRSVEPALLDWFSKLPAGAELIQSGQGTVELAVLGSRSKEKNATPSVVWSGTSIGQPGLYEVIVRIENPQPGTGLFLGDAEGTPVHHIGFFHEKRTDRTTFGYGWTRHGYLKPTDIRVEINHDPRIAPVPLAGQQQWLRVVVGFGGLKIWTSGDGQHWGRVGNTPMRKLQGGFSTVGLYAVPGEMPRKITLQQLEVRELSGLTSLAADEVRSRVPEFPRPEKIDIGEWLTQTITSRPEGIDMAQWRRACAIGLLEQHPSREFANTLLNALIEDGMQMRERSVEERLQLLDESALLLDLWDAAPATTFAQKYEKLGNTLIAEGEKAPYSQIVSALMATPIWSAAKIQTTPDSLVRCELLHHVYRSQWLQVHELYEQIRFWNETAQPNTRWWDRFKQLYLLLNWANAQAFEQLPKLEGNRSLIANKKWKHALISELSKEGYNVMAEFEAAIKGKAFKDACQIISAAGTGGLLGLLPDAQDPQLLVSLPAAVALAMGEYPDLRRTMSEQFGPIGLLRVRESIANADVAAVESASIRFYGTGAASEAHRWLGDRSLASGRFGEAIDRYRHAMKSTTSADRSGLLARLRLCAAMLGYEEGEPTSTTVEIGEVSLKPKQFEVLIFSLKETHSKTAVAGNTVKRPTAVSHHTAPKPAAYDTQTRAQFTGSMGKSAGSGAAKGIDWAARQISVVVDNKQIYVSNRFQVSAYDIATGVQKWVAGLGGEQGHAHHLPYVSMKPLVAGDRVFVRRLTAKGSEIACLESSSGKVVWRSRSENQIASDPVYVLGKLLALVQSFSAEGILQLDVARFHPDTGDILSQRPFLQMRDIWGRQPRCRVVSVDGKLLCVIGGTIASSDPTGQPIWVRRQTWIPSTQDPFNTEQHYDIPVVDSGRVYVAQAGVRAVECIEASSGRLVWSKATPGIKRTLGIVGANLIVETRFGLEALERNSGKLVWRHNAQRILDAHLVGGDGAVLYSQSVPIAKQISVPSLVWLNPKTGRELAHETLKPLANVDPQFGPLIATKEHLWALFGRGIKSPQRELIELVAAKNRVPSLAADESLVRWAPQTLPHIQPDVETVLPGWTLVSSKTTTNDGLRSELLGQKNVLITQAAAGKSIQFVRQLSVPADRDAALLLRIGHQPSTSWSLAVHLDRDRVAQEIIDDKSASNGWKDVRVDLKKYAGKTIWVTVAQHPIDPKQATTAVWKDLEIIEQ